MKKYIILFMTTICLMLFCVGVEAAGPKFPGWLTVMVPNVAQFDVPPILEVQSKAYRDIVRKKMPSYPEPMPGFVTLQKKGLLEQAQQGILEAHTVMITFGKRELGQDSGLKRSKLAMTPQDLVDFANVTKQDIMADKSNSYFDWTPATIEKLSCGEAIKIGYKRQYQRGPVTQYYLYYVFDGSVLYTMTVAYAVNEESRWCANYSDIRDIPSTIRIPKPVKE